jgi:hypothetical protein
MLCFSRFIGGQYSLEIQNIVIASCIVRYNMTSRTYSIYIPAQQDVKVSKDVKFDDDVRSSSS